MKKTFLFILPLLLVVWSPARGQQLIDQPTFQGAAQSPLNMGGYALTNMATNSIPITSFNVTGAASASTYLRGDGTWATNNPGISSVSLVVPGGLSVSGSPLTNAGTITVSTALSGLLKAGGGAFTNAVAGVDYITPGMPNTFTATQTFATNQAAYFLGNGAGLTGLSASAVSSGILATNYLASDVALTDKANTFTATQIFATNQAAYFLGGGAGLTGLNASAISSGTLATNYLASDVALTDKANAFTGAQSFTFPTFTLSGTSAGWYRVATLNGTGPVLFTVDIGVPGGQSIFNLLVNTTNGVLTAEVIGNGYLYTQYITQFRLCYNSSSGLGYLDLYATGGATVLTIGQNSNALLQFTANPSTTGLTTQTYTLPTTGSFFSDSITTTGQFIGSGAGISNLPSSAVIGTTTNNNASAGYVGEYVSSTLPYTSPVSLTSGTPVNVTSISLTPGDWDVRGNVVISPNSGTTTTVISGWMSTNSATNPTAPNSGAQYLFAGTMAQNIQEFPVGILRVSVGSTATVYLTAFSVFSGSTSSAYGFIGARRMR